MVAANAARSLSSSRCLATAPAAAALRDADCNISSQFHRVTYARKRSITTLAIAHACVSSHKSLHRQRGRTFSRRGSSAPCPRQTTRLPRNLATVVIGCV